jgi:hypothetical protein
MDFNSVLDTYMDRVFHAALDDDYGVPECAIDALRDVFTLYPGYEFPKVQLLLNTVKEHGGRYYLPED